MKTLTSKLMVVAAAIAAVAGAASAQSMKAEIPFSFKVSGTTMPAGAYLVTAGPNMNGRPVFRLLNTDVSKPVLAVPAGKHDGSSYEPAKLVFRCTGGNCALAQIWTGSGIGAYDLYTPKAKREEAALISIPANKAD